jgi:hypothetical protein
LAERLEEPGFPRRIDPDPGILNIDSEYDGPIRPLGHRHFDYNLPCFCKLNRIPD